MKYLLIIVIAFMFAGCAGINPEGTEAWGVFRDLEVTREYQYVPDKDKTVLTREHMSTKSTTSDIMTAFNEIMGTMSGTYEKFKP